MTLTLDSLLRELASEELGLEWLPDHRVAAFLLRSDGRFHHPYNTFTVASKHCDAKSLRGRVNQREISLGKLEGKPLCPSCFRTNGLRAALGPWKLEPIADAVSALRKLEGYLDGEGFEPSRLIARAERAVSRFRRAHEGVQTLVVRIEDACAAARRAPTRDRDLVVGEILVGSGRSIDAVDPSPCLLTLKYGAKSYLQKDRLAARAVRAFQVHRPRDGIEAMVCAPRFVVDYLVCRLANPTPIVFSTARLADDELLGGEATPHLVQTAAQLWDPAVPGLDTSYLALTAARGVLAGQLTEAPDTAR